MNKHIFEFSLCCLSHMPCDIPTVICRCPNSVLLKWNWLLLTFYHCSLQGLVGEKLRNIRHCKCYMKLNFSLYGILRLKNIRMAFLVVSEEMLWRLHMGLPSTEKVGVDNWMQFHLNIKAPLYPFCVITAYAWNYVIWYFIGKCPWLVSIIE